MRRLSVIAALLSAAVLLAVTSAASGGVTGSLDALRSFGCDSVQGFHFSRPLPAGDFAVWARSHAPDLAPTLLVA